MHKIILTVILLYDKTNFSQHIFLREVKMEIELKYILKEQMVKERLFMDSHIREIKNADTEKTINMHAIYYDTPHGDFSKKKMALRARFENERIIATLKWKGQSEGGLHVRGELNVPVNREYLNKPNVDIFKGSEIFDSISSCIGDKPLVKIMEMDYVRREVQVDTGKSISVISYDEGTIITEKGNCPISEIEIELYSGDQQDMMRLGKELEIKYNLLPSDISKFQKGMELINEKNQ